MVRNILLAFLVAFSISIYAQDNIDYSAVPLEVDEDFKKAEPVVINAADYVLSHPVDATDQRRLHAIQFIMAWMQGTPDYTFSLESIDKMDSNMDQAMAYIASLAKFTLEHNTAEESDPVRLRNGAWLIFLDYCTNPANSIKIGTNLKKMIDAQHVGKLLEELDK